MFMLSRRWVCWWSSRQFLIEDRAWKLINIDERAELAHVIVRDTNVIDKNHWQPLGMESKNGHWTTGPANGKWAETTF